MGKVETSLIDWGAAALTLPGQSRSGDRQTVVLFPGGALVAVVDGLGHGELAAVPAETAIEVLERHAREPVVTLIQRCHERLRGTRGAVMSLASFREADGTMTWLGVATSGGFCCARALAPSRARDIFSLAAGWSAAQCLAL